MQRLLQVQLQSVGILHRAGVRLLTGVDEVKDATIHDELQLLVEAGLSPVEAIRTATSSAAEFLGVAQSYGTITAGRSAGLVLLDANPLEDIENTRRIQAVVLEGQYFDSSALAELTGTGQ